MGNHLRSFQLCYKDRCFSSPLLLSISCSAELASEIKDQSSPNSGCLFRNDIGNFLITKVPSLFWGSARKPLASAGSAHHQQILLWLLALKLYLRANYTTSVIFRKVWWISSPGVPDELCTSPFQARGVHLFN